MLDILEEISPEIRALLAELARRNGRTELEQLETLIYSAVFASN